MPTIQPRTIIAYKGGGYDGCFWEWNYCFIDDRGEFHDIFSSGVLGCESLDELQERLIDSPSRWEKNFEAYRVDNADEMSNFAARECVGGVLACVSWAVDHPEERVNIPLRCDRCGIEIDAETAIPSHFRGEGGIVYVAKNLICCNCSDEEETNDDK